VPEDLAPGEDVLIVEDAGPVRVLFMNRPARLNALNTALTRALHDALSAARSAESVRAIVLAGKGRGFCSGADLTEFAELTPANRQLVSERSYLTSRTHMLLQEIEKPIVSAVQGAAAGGGAGLAIGCDMMVVASDLKLVYPELRHSIVPAIVMTGLQRQLGRKMAFELFSLGRALGAEEARALGLANRVVPVGEQLQAALEIAQGWSRAHPAAMAAAKSLFYRIADMPFDAAMEAGRQVNEVMRAFPERSS
jgi:enoyl-CoA hydratase/carnithine racemase